MTHSFESFIPWSLGPITLGLMGSKPILTRKGGIASSALFMPKPPKEKGGARAQLSPQELTPVSEKLLLRPYYSSFLSPQLCQAGS